MANFSINGVGIKNPSSFKIERYNVTNMERLANAEMVGDLIAKKRKFYFTYDAIKAKELNNILDIIWETDELFYTLSYLENGKQKNNDFNLNVINIDLLKETISPVLEKLISLLKIKRKLFL